MAVKTMNEKVFKAVRKPAMPTAKPLSVGPVATRSEAAVPPATPASPMRTRASKPIAVPAVAPMNAAIDETPPTQPPFVASGTAMVAISSIPTPNKKVASIMKNAEQFVAFSQANVEAFMKSSQIWTAGLQGLSKQMAANAQLALDETVSTLKAMTSVKSVKEAIELQTSLARSTVEKAVAGTTQITDASMKLAEETMAPITERMQAAASTFSIAA